MGVLTADQALASRLEELGFGVAAIRGQLVPTGKTVGTNIDLPLSSTAQQVLMFATDEADRVDSSTIQPSHLLTAIAQMEWAEPQRCSRLPDSHRIDSAISFRVLSAASAAGQSVRFTRL